MKTYLWSPRASRSIELIGLALTSLVPAPAPAHRRMKMEDAVLPNVWYWAGMRRNSRSITTSPETIKTLAELSKMNFDLLTRLAMVVGTNEKAERNFRNVVLMRLSKIETLVTLIHGVQIVEAREWKPSFEGKAREHAMKTDEWVAQKSLELGMGMIRYIYGEAEHPMPRHDRRRKWWGWEI